MKIAKWCVEPCFPDFPPIPMIVLREPELWCGYSTKRQNKHFFFFFKPVLNLIYKSICFQSKVIFFLHPVLGDELKVAMDIVLPFLFFSLLSLSGSGKGRVIKILTFAQQFTFLKAFYIYIFSFCSFSMILYK